jgi:hypothetical protein
VVLRDVIQRGPQPLDLCTLFVQAAVEVSDAKLLVLDLGGGVV